MHRHVFARRYGKMGTVPVKANWLRARILGITQDAGARHVDDDQRAVKPCLHRSLPVARHSDIVDRFNMGLCWLLLAVGLVAAVVVPARFLDGSSGQGGIDSRGLEYGILDIGDVVSPVWCTHGWQRLIWGITPGGSD